MSTTEMDTGFVVPATATAPPVRRLTIGDELARLAPGWGWAEVLRWPPDAFALTSALLGDSGVYRFVVCPPPGHRWPPAESDGNGEWQERIQQAAAAWADAATNLPQLELPDTLTHFGAVLGAAQEVELAALEDEAHWEIVVAILSLHALADEACAGAGLHSETPLQRLAAERLAETGTLARLSPDRVRVLPKLRPPESGITLRSLSHHLAIDRSEVETRWYFAPQAQARAEPATGRLSLLLVPFPSEVHASDFHPTAGPLLNMDTSRYDFFEYAPQEPLELDELLRLVEAAKRHIGPVDALVLPEAALDEENVEPLQELLATAGVTYLIAGARQPPGEGAPFAVNYAHLGGGDWRAPKQHKHHRWLLDAAQVHQYHLGAALDPSHSWWEAISIQRRSLTFATVSDWLTICPLVCEDLARPDPVTDVIRAVAPTLVVALLLDGPQLASRWPARYASVLADDPGCSVLTLTALGMTQRCQPPGFDPSRVIALWKDPHRGLQQIPLADGARAVALTAHARPTRLISADGRVGKDIPELVLSGLEQIH
jgi:hypothetical protein